MRRLYILLASAVIATTLIAVAAGVASAGDTFLDGGEYGALAVSSSLGHAYTGSANTRAKAIKDAYNTCHEDARKHPYLYHKDCQGAVWVRNGWVAVALEPKLDPQEIQQGHVSPDYEEVWGGGWAKTSNSAQSKALNSCYAKNPVSETCKVETKVATKKPLDEKHFDGGVWTKP
jgi:Domain of unknown function (DUF4189)